MLTIPEGLQWRVLWVPELTCSRLKPETLERLEQLLLSGATVIGPAPRLNPSLSGGMAADSVFTYLKHKLWGYPVQNQGDRRIGAA